MKETVYYSRINRKRKFRGIVFTDLDGTLLDSGRKLSAENLDALLYLEQMGFARVIATGRHYHSFSKVADESFPADYAIVSSGAGIWDIKKKRYIRIITMDEKEVESAVRALAGLALDFAVHRPIPFNHHFAYYLFNNLNDDFNRRIVVYKNYTQRWKKIPMYLPKACQVITIISVSDDHGRWFERVCEKLDFVTVIRTTSPLDHASLWIEVFPKEVSKGQTASWLADQFGLGQGSLCAFGNDYNDLDLLSWAEASFVMENAPADMRDRFTLVPSHDQSGFAYGVRQWLESIQV